MSNEDLVLNHVKNFGEPDYLIFPNEKDLYNYIVYMEENTNYQEFLNELDGLYKPIYWNG